MHKPTQTQCRWLAAAVGLLLASEAGWAAEPSTDGSEKMPDAWRVYAGTYTGGESEGIYLLRLDAESGTLTDRRLVAETPDPSFLAIHPSRRFLYATNERGADEAAVTAFAIDGETGALTEINQRPAHGGAPCHIVVDPAGEHAAIANYSGGNLAVYPLGEDGRLLPASDGVQHEGSSVTSRQEGPHAHCVRFAPDGRYLLAADLGLDQVLVYRFDRKAGELQPNDPPFAAVEPGSGPRHVAFHPSGRFLYAINELSSTVTAFAYDGTTGELTRRQTVSTLPEGFSGENYPAEIQVHPSGRFVYGSNRGHDSIAIFRVDPDDGTLQPAGHVSTRGSAPRYFGLDPTGRYLLAANQESNNVAVFRVDLESGDLTPVGEPVEVPSPVCLQMVPINS